MPDFIKAIEENLGRVFRYILPGILIVGAGHTSHPCWLRSVNFDSPWHLLTLGLVALAVGNTWYAVHRYGIEQLIDMVLTAFRRAGPALPEKAHIWSFADVLAAYVVRAYASGRSPALREHIALRAAGMHLA